MKLNLGSGFDYRKGWVNVECAPTRPADIRHDLDKFPYPFKKNTFDEVVMINVLEHLREPIKCLKEVIRISKDKAILKVVVPHAHSPSAFGDLQHRNFFTEHTFKEHILEEYGLSQLGEPEIRFVSMSKKNWWKRYIPFRRYLNLFFMGLYDEIEFKFTIKK